MRRIILAVVAALTMAGMASAQEATFTIKQLTPDTALKLVKATLEACRAQGYQVGVAVVDRAGVTQAFVRDRFAGPHTVTVAIDKAWTAVSMRADTLGLAAFTADVLNGGLRSVPRFTAIGGGVPIEAAGNILGAIGVSGAPGGQADDTCAREGLKAIAEDLEF